MSETEQLLKPANENPWYVLMTLYGEQDGEKVDDELHEKNRAAWNAWAGQSMTEEERVELASRLEINANEFVMWTRRRMEIPAIHEAIMVERNGSGFSYPGFPDVEENIDLSRVTFLNKVVTVQFFIPCNITFSGASFSKHFYGYISNFNGTAKFKNVSFAESISFDGSAFKGKVSFSRCNFGDAVNFSETRFEGGLAFFACKFQNHANFINCKFAENVSFDFSVFFNSADFTAARFDGHAFFSNTIYTGNCRFDETIFAKDILFDNSVFNDGFSASSSSFGGYAKFSKAKFLANQKADILKDGSVNFDDCNFMKPTSFQDAIFSEYFPDFSGTMLHERTNFTVNSKYWPRSPKNGPEQAKSSCAVIRHNVGKQGLPEEEHFFFRREMGFAAQIGGWWQRLPYRVFGAVSDFGYSIQRPALWLFGLWLAVAMINHVVLQWAASRDGAEYHVVQAFGLSFANQFPVFGLQSRWFSAEFLSHLNPWLKALGGAQTVVALPLLFFFALGLRTRFRMR